MRPSSPRRDAAPRPAASRGTARAPHELRIIGGQWRRHKLPVPDAPGLRPTPDRVRETLFNWLGQDLSGWTVLDAFAGTGALGFEAASRGAARVQMLERDPTLARGLLASRERLGASAVSITQADALGWMRRGAEVFELVLLDPPFEAELFEAALGAALPCLVPDGWIYLEAPRRFDEAALAGLGLECHRHVRAGTVHAHLLRRAATSATP